MKKRILLLSTGALFISAVLLSNAGGPAHVSYLNRSGSDGSPATCTGSGCHGGGSYYLDMPSIELYDLQFNQVAAYTPGDTYAVQLGGKTDAVKWGFQISSAHHHGTSWDPAGKFLVTNTNGHDTTINGFSILEHNVLLTPSTSGGFLTMNMRWVAPADTSIDSITFRCTYNLVNNDGLAGGDNSFNTNLKVFKQGFVASTKDINAEIKFKAYPNPVSDQLNIEMQNADKGTYTIQAFDINGKIVASQIANVNGSFNTSINTTTWAKGIYHLQLKKDGAQKTISVVKQ